MSKLVSLPDLSPDQVDLLEDACATVAALHGQAGGEKFVLAYTELALSLRYGIRLFSSVKVDSLCHALDAFIQYHEKELSSPLLSPSVRTSAEHDLENAQSLLSLLLPLVPDHREVQHPV